MDIKAFLEQVRKIKNYAENLNEIDRVSALDEAILKKNVEKLYEILVSDYMNEDITQYNSPKDQSTKSKVVEESFSFDTSTVERDNTRVAETPVSREPIFDFDDSDDESAQSSQSTKAKDIEPTSPESPSENGSELDELFNIEEGSELSHKLSQTKVTDIMKAMGLNERIFTQNELFGGSFEDFRDVVEKLNNVESFSEAKELLKEEVAHNYDWNKPERKQVAINFIRLIHRRYK